MTTEERISKQRELIEDIGRYFEKEGFQPIAGRILGLLMVMDKERYTFDEITEELQISKSSASNALKNLEIRGNIEYVTLPGDRKRYFQVKLQDTSRFMDEMQDKVKNMLSFFHYILELKADKNSRNSVFLKKTSDYLEYLLEQLSISIERYKDKQKV